MVNVTPQNLKQIYTLTPEELYGIGATALDSSIMLTFRNITGYDQEQKDLEKGYILYYSDVSCSPIFIHFFLQAITLCRI